VLAGRDKSDISDQRRALSLYALLSQGSPRVGCGEDQEAEHVNRIVVEVFWDAEASVGVATNDELHLATEAPTVEALIAKLPGMIQDLSEDVDTD
jgi:hypothetical protein